MLVLAHGPPMASCYTWEVTSKALTMAYKTLCNLASLHSSIPKQCFLSSPRSALVTWAPWQSLNSQLHSCFSQGSFHWLFFSIFRSSFPYLFSGLWSNVTSSESPLQPPVTLWLLSLKTSLPWLFLPSIFYLTSSALLEYLLPEDRQFTVGSLAYSHAWELTRLP